jgi:hypothetical protein
VLGAFSTRRSGNLGHEILGPDGTVIAWTVDEVMATLITKLLTDNEN